MYTLLPFILSIQETPAMVPVGTWPWIVGGCVTAIISLAAYIAKVHAANQRQLIEIVQAQATATATLQLAINEQRKALDKLAERFESQMNAVLNEAKEILRVVDK